jgi:hypothetical protein
MLMSVTPPYIKASVALWIIIAGTLGTRAPVTTPSGWFILAALATAPPLIFMRHWILQPAQTTSERIQKAIR